MKDIYVIDNFVSKDYQMWIENIVINQPELPWYYKQHAIDPKRTSDPRNVECLFHYLYEDEEKKSPLFDAIYPLVLNISEKAPDVKFNALDRMRINLMPKHKDVNFIGYHLPHIDNYHKGGWNAIYYINNVKAPDDGDTFIFKQSLEKYTQEENEKIVNDNYFEIEQKITPKRGRMVIFSNRYYHASSWSNTADRYVVNINLITKEIL